MRYLAPFFFLIALTLTACAKKQETAHKADVERQVATYSVEDFYKTNKQTITKAMQAAVGME